MRDHRDVKSTPDTKLDTNLRAKLFRPANVILFCVLLQVVTHWNTFKLPPMGPHVWRQVVGHAMARNYFTEDDRFFHPRNDIRISDSDDGRIWHEFPLAYYLIGKSYQITGFQHANARVIWFALLICLLPIMYAFVRLLGYGKEVGMLAVFLLSCSPYYNYYVITLAPNILGLMFFMAGVTLTIQALRRPHHLIPLIFASVFLTLGVLSKPTYLFFGFPLLVLVWQSYRQSHDVRHFYRAAFAISVIGIATWLTMRHAGMLYNLAPPEQQVHTPFGPAEVPADFAQIWRNLWTAFSKWFLELFIGTPVLPFFFAGAVLFFREPLRISTAKPFWLAWLLSFAIFISFFVVRLADHSYYITSILPFGVTLSAIGAYWMLQRPRWKVFAVILLVVAPAFGWGRVAGRWSKSTEMSKTILERSDEINALIPEGERIFVVGDSTPIVDLYFLERKGLSLLFEVTDEEFRNYVRQGIRYLVLKGDPQQLQPFQSYLTKLGSVEEFSVYRVDIPIATE